MPRHAQEKATKRPDAATERGGSQSRVTHPSVPAIKPRDPSQAGKPVEADQEKRSKQADVGEAAEQGGSGEKQRG